MVPQTLQGVIIECKARSKPLVFLGIVQKQKNKMKIKPVDRELLRVLQAPSMASRI